MHQLPQQLVIGLSIGASYALIALGYTMVYGVLRLINFAHGDVYMVGGISGYYLVNLALKLGCNPWLSLGLALIGAMLICAVLGFTIERFAYRPLRNRPRLVVLITAIGVSLLLESLAQLPAVFGPTPHQFPAEIHQILDVAVLHTGPIILSRLDALCFALSLTFMAALTWIVMKTRTGIALRAVSYRFDTATLMGIDTNRIVSVTFILGSALAAVAGVTDGIRYDVQPLMGVLWGLKAFIAAVLGGIGSIPGALVGGLLIGITESLVGAYISTAYVDAIAFVILILILLIKPSGLFGRHVPEKV